MPVLNSRVWLVTGTSSGIGLALLKELLGSSERVVATLRNPSVLENLIPSYPDDKLLILPLDVTNQSQVDAVFQKTKAHFGRLDVMVNNAGVGSTGEVEATSEDVARHMFEVNFWASAKLSKQAVQFFRDENPAGLGGRLLNISSALGFQGAGTMAFYSASKFALEGFTESLLREINPEWNIKGTIIQPGGFRTAFQKENMTVMEQPSAYRGSETPSTFYRQWILESEYRGDPKKAALAIIEISKETNPPLRLPLGPQSFEQVKEKAGTVLVDCEKWAPLSLSTDISEEASS